MRGSGQKPSIIGVTKCSPIDWVLYGSLIAGCLAITVLSVCLQRREYEFKKQLGYEFVPGDFKCTTRNALGLTWLGCLFGFMTAMTGIGPGVMTNALMLKLDVHPLVAGETG